MKRSAFIFFLLVSQSVISLELSAAERSADREQSRKRVEFTYEQSQILVGSLYRGILFRESDPEGLRHFSYHLVKYGYDGLLDVAVYMVRSLEYRKNIEFVLPANTIANNMYVEFFDREMLESTPWPDLIAQGKSDYAVWRIVASDEFFEKNILTL